MNNLTKLLLVIVIFGSVTPALLFSQSWVWEKQAEGLAYNWEAIDAIDSNVAVAIAWMKIPSGGEGIFRTLNGGKSWHELSWIEGHPVLIDISITDSLNIWVATNHSICNTSDGGNSWEVQYSNHTIYFSYIEMFDSLNGIAEADAPLEGIPVQILKTNDGGKKWLSQNTSYFTNGFLSYYWRAIDFVSPNIGYGGFVYFNTSLDTIFLQKTTDGGITWNKTELSMKNIHTIKFFNEDIGLAVSLANQPVFRTLDGGKTWTSYPLNFNHAWSNDIEFIPHEPAKILAIFDASLYFSEDTGKTWIELATPVDFSFRDIEMVDDRHGWIVGEGGIIYTSTGGLVVNINEKKTVNKKFELNQNFPNPFNSTTIIAFQLYHADRISLKVYNLKGEQVAILLNDQYLSAGEYRIQLEAIDLPSGIYIYKLQIHNNQCLAKRMILIK